MGKSDVESPQINQSINQSKKDHLSFCGNQGRDPFRNNRRGTKISVIFDNDTSLGSGFNPWVGTFLAISKQGCRGYSSFLCRCSDQASVV